MQSNNWSQFKLRVNINTSIQKAYEAWTTPAGLESWFLRNADFTDDKGNKRSKETFVQPGENYEWQWHGYPDNVLEKGKVLQANGNDQFKFTFSLGCPVNISIYTEHHETIVELVESNLPSDEETMLKHYVGDSKGWIFYLANLKSVLEGGLDLRNKKIEISNVITA